MAPRSDPNRIRFLQAKIPEWFNMDIGVGVGGRPAPGKKSQRSVALKLGVSNTTLVRFLSDGWGAQKIEESIIREQFGGSVDKMRAAANEWAALNPPLRVAARNSAQPDLIAVKDELHERIIRRARQRNLGDAVIEAADMARARHGVKTMAVRDIDVLLDLALGFGQGTDLLFGSKVVRDAGAGPVDDFREDPDDPSNSRGKR